MVKEKYVLYPVQNESRWNYTMGKTMNGCTVILSKDKRHGPNEIKHEWHCDKSRIDTY